MDERLVVDLEQVDDEAQRQRLAVGDDEGHARFDEQRGRERH